MVVSRHSFEPAIAAQVGIAAAVIYQNIRWWVEKNAANQDGWREGRYWTFNSVAAYEELFPYLTAKQIRTALEKLEEAGLILVGNFNSSAYNRTKWYTIADFEAPAHLPKGANEVAQGGKSSTDINTVLNTPLTPQGDRVSGMRDSGVAKGNKPKRTDAYSPEFDAFWKAWPEPRRIRSDKRKAFERWSRAAAAYGADRISAAAAKYLASPDVRKDGWRYCCLAEVFLNGKLEAAIEAVEPASQTKGRAHYGDERWARMVRAYAAAGLWDDARGPRPTEADIAWARNAG